ncbi:MAG: inositol monophosphatase [Alphaproteobacteria bacterium]|nr:inositol monophosphatase [Alphaproteobacteria bacterium]
MAVRSALITVMAAAADKAARRLIRDFNEVEQLQVSRKGPADFASAADLMAERTLKTELAKARPGAGMLAEESAAEPSRDGTRWIIDPLDGTLNFLHGIPHFAISIAFESQGDVVAGLVFDPIKNETYWAENGRGAYVNDRRLRVSSRKYMEDALIVHGQAEPGPADRAPFWAEIEGVIAAGAAVRRFGAAALDLAYVAAGRFDGYWEAGVKPWDIAAGALIVREAGGLVTESRGGTGYLESGDILAATPLLHPLLLKTLARVRHDPAMVRS